jgi:hypothetical protein
MPISFWRLCDIDQEGFVQGIERLNLITDPSDVLDCLVTQYNDVLRSLIGKHSPVVTKNVVLPIRIPFAHPRHGSLKQHGTAYPMNEASRRRA